MGFSEGRQSYNMPLMRLLADESKVRSLIEQLAGSIDRQMKQAFGKDEHGWALVGIRSRGDILADRIALLLGRQQFEGRVGCLDITLYRDDLSEIGPQPIVRTTEIPFGIDGVNVVLVDDVLMTGRSVRAALQSLMDLGRPHRVWLSVLVDRGGRELPIAPDHVALDVTVNSSDPAVRLDKNDQVVVMLKPHDDQDAIVVQDSGM